MNWNPEVLFLFWGSEVKKTRCRVPRPFCSFLSRISLPVSFILENLYKNPFVRNYIYQLLIYSYTGPQTEFFNLETDVEKITQVVQGEILQNFRGFPHYIMRYGARHNIRVIYLQMEDECQEDVCQVRPLDRVYLGFKDTGDRFFDSLVKVIGHRTKGKKKSLEVFHGIKRLDSYYRNNKSPFGSPSDRRTPSWFYFIHFQKKDSIQIIHLLFGKSIKEIL